MYSVCIYTLLKVVSYCRFECSVQVSDGSKKKFGWGVGGWGELYPSFFGIFLTLQSPLERTTHEWNKLLIVRILITTSVNDIMLTNKFAKDSIGGIKMGFAINGEG